MVTRNKINATILVFAICLVAAIGIAKHYMSKKTGKIKVRDFYGKSFNSIRLRNTIPVIEDDWVIHRADSNYVRWFNKARRLSTVEPVHFNKTVGFHLNEIAFEEDDFHFEGNATIAYRLVCQVRYDSSILKFRYIEYFKNSYPPTRSYNVNKEFADSIFREWELPKYYTNLNFNLIAKDFLLPLESSKR